MPKRVRSQEQILKHRMHSREHYRKNKIVEAAKKRNKWQNDPEYRKRCKLKHAVYFSNYCRSLRLKIYEMYGQRCTCCGETNYCFLSIDHINGGGSKEKKQFNQTQYLKFVIAQGYSPEKYQILCHNCNQARGYYGTCPHKGDPTNPVSIEQKAFFCNSPYSPC